MGNLRHLSVRPNNQAEPNYFLRLLEQPTLPSVEVWVVASSINKLVLHQRALDLDSSPEEDHFSAVVVRPEASLNLSDSHNPTLNPRTLGEAKRTNSEVNHSSSPSQDFSDSSNLNSKVLFSEEEDFK